MRIPYPIMMVGIILFVILLLSGSYFFRYNPMLKKIDNLKKYIKSSESELTAAKLKLSDYKPISDDERLLGTQTQEELLTVISNKEHLLLLTNEVANVASSVGIRRLLDMSYQTSQPGTTGTTGTTGAANSAALSASEPGQVSNESGAATSAKIDYTFLKMRFYCKYGELLDFLKSLNQLRRLVSIESLSIKQAIPEVLVEITFRAYYWET